jgi:AmmeMemoRadiSam system protein B
MHHAGLFYPASMDSVRDMISRWEEAIPDIDIDFFPRALVLPHAGYDFSGVTAQTALHQVDFSAYDRVIILGPSHHHYLDDLSFCSEDEYEIPGGTHPIDTAYTQMLKDTFQGHYISRVHREHSTEVLVPLISCAADIPVVEVIYGMNSYEFVYSLMQYLFKDRKNLIIVSSDLSHFHRESEAHAIDRRIVSAFEHRDTAKLRLGEACGFVGLQALLTSIRQLDFSTQVVDYRTSADSGLADSQKVVGYMGVVAGE